MLTCAQLAGEGLFISQYIILVCCSRAPYTWAQLAGGTSSFLNRLYWFGIVGSLYTVAQLAGEASLV